MPRGRPLGSTGILGIKLSDLNLNLLPESIIPVRSSFARQLFSDKLVIIKPKISTESTEKTLTKTEDGGKLNFTIIKPE